MDLHCNHLVEEYLETDSLENTYLTFYSNQLCFGLPVSDVIQIIGMQEITPVPEFPPYTKGVINLRGNIVSVVDFSIRLCKVETQYTDKTCIIITRINNILVGFIVDEVDEVKQFTSQDIVDPSELSSEVEDQYLTGIAKIQDRIMLLVNTQRLLTER